MAPAPSALPALHGGDPVRATPFPGPPALGEAERRAVDEVMRSGVLSQYIGAWHEDFHGGPRVRALETAWAERFGVRHALSMNSATSALYAATAAAGVGPGDEVIVSPYTMTASAVCALVHGAVPVFADIDPDTFCLDPESVRARITPRTKAIVAVDLFGLPADFDALMAIAREHGLVVIEDAAQAPGASRHGRPAGTLGHIGVFSLNYHKTIHCGEGGVAVTDDDRLAQRLALARNHGEAAVQGMGTGDYDVLGYNYRMGEIEAAIALVQLGRLEALTAPRGRHDPARARGRAPRLLPAHAAAGSRRARRLARGVRGRRAGRGRAGRRGLRRAAVPPAAVPRARGSRAARRRCRRVR